jgi:pyruvate dehydrogenase E1 component
MRSRGFLLGGTAGRTTLNGEGLQHQDGTSHLVASTVPNCRAWDPCFGYELAVIVQDGMRRMLDAQEDVFYYITVMNENYVHPALPQGTEQDILRGMYLYREASGRRQEAAVQLLGSGTILREVIAAADMLERDWQVAADVWSVTSFTELRRDGMAVEHHNRYQPEMPPRHSHVTQCLGATRGPVVAASDYVRAVADLIRPYVPRHYTTLGTDGFGRSDSRAQLRDFFEVSAIHIVIAALQALAAEGSVAPDTVSRAIAHYGITSGRALPWES